MGKNPSQTQTSNSTKNSKTTETTDYTANQNTGQSGVQRVDAPDWLLNPAQKLAGSLGGLIGAAPPAQGFSNLETDAAMNAGRLGNQNQSYLKAAETLRGIGGAGDINTRSLLTGLDKYENPYKDQVLNPVLDDFDVNSGKVRAQQAAQGALGAFRGSRFGVREAGTEGELARGRAATEGGLLNQMFDTSTRLSGEDAGRELTAAQANQQTQLANQQLMLQKANQQSALNQAMNADARSAVDLQGRLGGQYTDRMNEFAQQPIQHQANLTGLLQGLNPASYFGQSSDQTGFSNTTGHQDSVGTEDTVATGKEKSTSNPGLFGKIQGWMNVAKDGAKLAAML